MEGDGSPVLKRRRAKLGRSYQSHWDESYYTIFYNDKIQCVICRTALAEAKESNIKRHYNTHKQLFDEWNFSNPEQRLEKFLQLKKIILTESTSSSADSSFSSYNNNSSSDPVAEKLTRASYRIAECLMKHGKPFTDGEIVKKCLLIAAEEVPDVKLLSSISLSRTVVTQRAEDIGDDLARQLKELCPKFVKFSLALDESTDITDTAQLCVFIKGTTIELENFVDLLDIVPLLSTTTGEDIFEKVEELFETFNLEWKKLQSVSTDGAAAMTGLMEGFRGRISAKIRDLGLPDISFIHCWIHHEQLCAKPLEQANEILKVITEVVNLIRGSALNHREFKLLVEDFDLDCEDLLHYSAVRWLSCGKTVSRFVKCKEPIQIFLRERGIDVPEVFWVEVGFHADICSHLNKLNLNLQGKKKLIIDVRDKLKAFKLKLLLYKMQISNNNLECFPLLKSFCSKLSVQQITEFTDCLSNLHQEFCSRFSDLEMLSEKFLFFTSPFTADPMSPHLPFPAEELIELQCNSALDDAQKRLPIDEFWLRVAKTKNFPGICSFAAGIFCMFPTTYNCKSMFSLMKFAKNKYRARLSDKNLSPVLRIMTASQLKPDIAEIVRQRKQCQSAKSAKSND